VELGWQDFVVLGIVAAATGYLARLAWGAVVGRPAGGCGSNCGKCSGKSNAGHVPAGQVVSIHMPERHTAITSHQREVT
jgi:hypothetical protein